MKYEYKPKSLIKEYENERFMKKKYGVLISEGMQKFLRYVESAKDAYDIKSIPFFYMEHKVGNLSDHYAVSLDKKKSKWRLMIQMLDDNGNVMVPTDNEKEFLKSIYYIRIKELSEHYANY
ncbi:MAG: hypothetical protein MJ248_05260 [Bacilli bacterium]|nr:hypothetical protein [Bacilli bacterium]